MPFTCYAEIVNRKIMKLRINIKMNIIAIDGSSSAGKGTLASRLAKTLDYAYLDTGALYRGVGYEMLQRGQNPEDEKLALEIALNLSFQKMLCLQDESDIRNEVCGKAASQVSALPSVRKALFNFQRSFAEHPIKKDGTPAKGAILDGRDIGTVICPDAAIKIFLTARPEIRAERRFKELQSRGICAIYENVLSDINARDKRDRERATAPLRAAEDAFVIDTSDMTTDEVFAAVVRYMEQQITQKSPK